MSAEPTPAERDDRRHGRLLLLLLLLVTLPLSLEDPGAPVRPTMSIASPDSGLFDFPLERKVGPTTAATVLPTEPRHHAFPPNLEGARCLRTPPRSPSPLPESHFSIHSNGILRSSASTTRLASPHCRVDFGQALVGGLQVRRRVVLENIGVDDLSIGEAVGLLGPDAAPADAMNQPAKYVPNPFAWATLQRGATVVPAPARYLRSSSPTR